MKDAVTMDFTYQPKKSAIKLKNSFEYSNIPVTRRDLRDFERRLLKKLSYRLGALLLFFVLAFVTVFVVVLIR